MTDTTEQTIRVTSRGLERARNGHLWIYKSDLAQAHGAAAPTRGGTVVRVEGPRKEFVAKALYSDRSEISLRILTTRAEVIDKDWWRARLRAAIARRAAPSADNNAFRAVYADGDLLPSLIVDYYNGIVVLQTLSQGTDALKSMFAELLVELLHPVAIVERNDVRVRALEGLDQTASVLYGTAPDEVEILQQGVRFLLRPLVGQKTGAFLDQRENHVAAAAVAHGKALDCFTFNGGFALHLARACTSVTALDISADAIAEATRNQALNSITNVEFREANVFDALRDMERDRVAFDTIVLDPPAFAKNHASVKAALRGYNEINLRALKMLSAGGILVSCSCSYHISEQMFVEILAAAARDARRKVQIVEKRMQASDHPVLLSMPETHYLKCVILRVVG